jgi:hypothetical protein
VRELFAQALIPEIDAMLHSVYDLLDALRGLTTTALDSR